MDEAAVLSARSYKHPLFAIAIPVGFIWLATAFLSAAVGALATITPVYPILYILAALSETAVGNYLRSKKSSGMLPRMRELVVVLLFSFVFIKFTNGDVFRGDWKLARFDIVLPILFTAVEWIFAIVIHSALRERELLLSLIAGKERAELKEYFRSMGTEAGNSLAGMLRVRRIIVAFQVLAFVGLFFLALARPQAIRPGLVLLMILHFATGVILFFTLTGYVERQALMGEGFTVPQRIVSRRAGFAAALCLLAALVLIPVVGREAPLPSSYLQDFIAWLQKITTLPERAAQVRDADTDVGSTDMQLPDQSKALEGLGGESQANTALQRFFRILIIVLVAGVPAVVILVLLVAPLFRKREEKIHPLRALREWLLKTMGSLSKGIRNFVASLRYRSRSQGKRKSLREMILGSGRSGDARSSDARAGFFQRLAMSREIKTFVKVIRWGERRGVEYRRCLGPGEYASSLGTSAPEVSGELVRLADILEELLFSGREIAPERSEQYFEAARLVLRHR